MTTGTTRVWTLNPSNNNKNKENLYGAKIVRDNPSSLAHQNKIIGQSRICLKIPSRQPIDENDRQICTTEDNRYEKGRF